MRIRALLLPLRIAATLAALVSSLPGCGGPTSSSAAPEHFVDPGALGPYSSAVQVDGLVLLSGKIGERGGTFEHEVSTCIDAIEATLAQAGLDLSHVVEARVYLTDMERYGEFNAIYGARFRAPYPARTCVAVKALPGGARVEVQVAARR